MAPDPSGSPGPAFGARLRGLRQSRRWTQRTLARRAGLTQPAVSMLEAGRRLPLLDTAAALAAAFGVAVDELTTMGL